MMAYTIIRHFESSAPPFRFCSAEKENNPMPRTIKNKNTEIPEWFDDTPEELNYELTVWESRTGDHPQLIELTRAEYLALKGELARIRGIVSEEAPQPAGARDYEPGGHTCNDILTALDALESAGACHMAYCRFFKDAEPAELRWLAGVLTLRIEDPRLRLSECVESHVRPYSARAGRKPAAGEAGSGDAGTDGWKAKKKGELR